MSKRLQCVVESLRRGAPMNDFLADCLAEAIRRGDVFCVYEAEPDSLERLAALQREAKKPDKGKAC